MNTNVFSSRDSDGKWEASDGASDWFLSGRAPSPRDAGLPPLFPRRADADMPPAAIVFPRLPEE